ncbi:MAG: YcxB family protein [Saprospiraceae bacterium]|nr:YcxB family protein [Saprospiraceae bacterium]
MNIQLQFTLTAAEYVNLMRYIVNWRRYAWLMGFALLFVGVQVFLNGPQALLYLLVIVVFAIFMYFSTQRSIRKVFEMSPHLNLPLRYHITEDEFQVITDEVQNSYPWDMFWKAREVPEWFLLHQNERVYNYVPKRAFNSPAEVEEFRKFLVMKGLL